MKKLAYELIHAHPYAQNIHNKAPIISIDTNDVILPISKFHSLSIGELWNIGFWKHFRMWQIFGKIIQWDTGTVFPGNTFLCLSCITDGKRTCVSFKDSSIIFMTGQLNVYAWSRRRNFFSNEKGNIWIYELAKLNNTPVWLGAKQGLKWSYLISFWIEFPPEAANHANNWLDVTPRRHVNLLADDPWHRLRALNNVIAQKYVTIKRDCKCNNLIALIKCR